MKSTPIALSLMLALFSTAYSQVTTTVQMPLKSSSTSVRLPNGNIDHAFHRGATIVLGSELTKIPPSTTLSSVGFSCSVEAVPSVTGNITIYMKNSTDVNFTLGNTWTTVISGMTTVYSGTFLLPGAPGPVDLPLQTPFVYTGGAIYVAYDFTNPGPYTTYTLPAVWAANHELNNGCVAASSSVSAPTSVGSAPFRPVVRFQFPNPFSNDVSIETVGSVGQYPMVSGSPNVITAIVRNSGTVTATNIAVNLNVSGANTFTNTQTVPSLTPTAVTTVTFAGFTPTVAGSTTVSIMLGADQFSVNNSYTQVLDVNCNYEGYTDATRSHTLAGGFGTGSGIMASKFIPPVTTSVTGSKMYISGNANNGGKIINMALLDNTGTILASTNTMMITGPMYNTWQTFTFSLPTQVSAGQTYYIGFAQASNTVTGWSPPGGYVSAYVAPGQYIITPLAGGTPTNLSAQAVVGLQAMFSGTCLGTGIENNTTEFSEIITYPNPASDKLTIQVNNASSTIGFEIYNTIGQQVLQKQMIIDGKAEINISTLPKGIYFARIKNGERNEHVKIIIEK